MSNRSPSLLNIPIDPGELALLETAAKQAHMSLGDFIRHTAIQAAETELLERRRVTVPTENWDRIEAWIDTPPKDIPVLRLSTTIQPAGSIRLLTPDDDRYAFDCQRESLNRWFWHYAWRDQETGMARIHVATDPTSGDIIGFVSLSLAEIRRTPEPSYGASSDISLTTLPAVLLSRIAVDQRYQRLGHARSLLRFALASTVRVTRNTGGFCALTHPLDDQVRTFFRTLGFEAIPGDPAGGMVIRVIDLERNFELPRP